MRFDTIPNTAWVASQTDVWAKDDALQAGVAGRGDLAVGGSLAVFAQISVAAGAIWLPDSSHLLQRHVAVANNDVALVGVAPAVNTSRIDTLFAIYAGPGQAPTYQYFVGTQQNGAATVTYLNRAGASAPPANSVALADYILANSGLLNITRFDRRPWATGGSWGAKANTTWDSGAGGATTWPGDPIPGLNLYCEFSGAPVTVAWWGTFQQGNSAGAYDVYLAPTLDGLNAGIPGDYGGASDLVWHQTPIGWQQDFNAGFTFTFTPPATGRHNIGIRAWSAGNHHLAIQREISVWEKLGDKLMGGQ